MFDDFSLNQLIPISDRIMLSSTNIKDIIMDLRNIAITNNLIDQFENILNIDSKRCYELIGFTKEEFVFIYDYLEKMRSSGTRYLIKLFFLSKN